MTRMIFVVAFWAYSFLAPIIFAKILLVKVVLIAFHVFSELDVFYYFLEGSASDITVFSLNFLAAGTLILRQLVYALLAVDGTAGWAHLHLCDDQHIAHLAATSHIKGFDHYYKFLFNQL